MAAGADEGGRAWFAAAEIASYTGASRAKRHGYVGNMTRLAARQGREMDIRVMVARVGNDYRFIGYDMSARTPSGRVTEGFVEAERGTALVGQRLFADRNLRALQSGAPSMTLQVHVSPRTEDFHARIYQIVGREGQPRWGDPLILPSHAAGDDPRRARLGRGPDLSAEQRSQFVALANGVSEPTPADVQSVLRNGQNVAFVKIMAQYVGEEALTIAYLDGEMAAAQFGAAAAAEEQRRREAVLRSVAAHPCGGGEDAGTALAMLMRQR